MIRTVNPPAVLLAGMIFCLTSCPGFGDDVPTAEPTEVAATSTSPTAAGVQFETDFSLATGASMTRTIGSDPEKEEGLHGKYSIYASTPEDSSETFTMSVTEDNTTSGPDGQPGVLRLQYVELPARPNFSGFVLLGDLEQGNLLMPGWTLGELTLSDLRRTFIEFKFRAENPNDDADIGGMYLFRFEPGLPDSFKLRADFGTLIATHRWRTFRRPIGSATNLDAFLKATNEGIPQYFKLVWSQNDHYAPGESLLIDDLKIVVE